MVAHFSGKVAFDGVRAVREGWERGASVGIREGERRGSRGRASVLERARDGTDGLPTAQGKRKHGIEGYSRAENSMDGCAGRCPETEQPPREWR